MLMSEYFSQPFKDKVMKKIATARPVFEREMANRVGKSMEFGYRFKRDSEVLARFFADYGMIGRNPYSIQQRAYAIEKSTRFTSDEFRLRIWKALSDAAESDYYYEHEKDWE